MKLGLKTITIATLLSLSLFSSAFAQGKGRAPANPPQNQQNCESPCYGGPGSGRGMMGPGGGRGMMGHGQRGMGNHAYMMQLITQQEWIDFQNKIRMSKTYDECVSAQQNHWSLMETRAKEKNLPFSNPAQNGWKGKRCEMWQAQGLFK